MIEFFSSKKAITLFSLSSCKKFAILIPLSLAYIIAIRLLFYSYNSDIKNLIETSLHTIKQEKLKDKLKVQISVNIDLKYKRLNK